MVSMGKNFHVDCFRCEVSDSDREATSQQLQKFIVKDSTIVAARLFAVNRNRTHTYTVIINYCNSPIAFYILRYESWLHSFIVGDKPT